MSGKTNLPEKAVVIRTGGLGDFVSTIPLFVSLVEEGCELTVATRHEYFNILGDFQEKTSFIDADEVLTSDAGIAPRKTFGGATVFSFWKDGDGSLQNRFGAWGILDFVELESRPNEPPHLVERIFQKVGIQWKEDFFTRSWLRANRLPGEHLWVHPGSGSPAKNAPLEWFLERIQRWLAEGEGDSVLVSFGEADGEVEKTFRDIRGRLPLEFIRPGTLRDLRDELMDKAVLFVGNDSGPSHLSSALGIPTEVVYTTTNPEIWRPIGERVTTIRPGDLT